MSGHQSRMVPDEAVRKTAACPPMERVPDFFIVGHHKCGTTALYEMLRCHPEIYMPEFKEPQFFTTELRYRFKAQWSLDDYLSLFSAARPDQLAGESSTFYLWSQTAASRIADLQPAARIIAILREPASFLRSLHLQFVQDHLEMEKDFRKALALEGARRQGQHHPRSLSDSPQLLLYSDHVRYVTQLLRYQALFPAGQVLVLIYDDFRNDNEAIWRSVLRFLDVDDGVPFEVNEANPSVRVRSVYLNSLVRAIYAGQGPVSQSVKTGIKALMPRKLRHDVLYATQRHIIFGRPEPADEELMTELRHRFKSEVVALSQYLDRDLVNLWGYDKIK